MKFIFIILFSNLAIFSQECKLVEDIKNSRPILLGISTVEAYQDSNFSWWFNYSYDKYNVDTNLVSEHKANVIDKKITIVLGTWCSDSQREVPRFIKILDFIGFPKDSLELINVDRNKEGLENEVNGLDIELVPTIIVYDKGEEIGRIIESPMETLEEDLVEIVK